MNEPEADGYLHRFDDDLGGALGLVILDLLTAGIDEDDASRWVWDLAEHEIDNTFGTEPAGLTALWVAENLQERVIKTRFNTWPACPEHPNHPLWLSSPHDFNATWTCPASGRPIARLGKLGTLGELDQP
jgi:hypothetical protein